jgi:hypothetical protein
MIKIPQSIQSIWETIFMDKNYKLLIVDQKREKDQKNAYNALNYQFNGYIHSL